MERAFHPLTMDPMVPKFRVARPLALAGAIAVFALIPVTSSADLGTSAVVVFAGQGGRPADASAPKSFAETVQGCERIPGLFTLYRDKKGSKDRLYMEVSREQLGQDFLLQATAASGESQDIELFNGAPLSDKPFRLILIEEDQIQMVEPDTSQRAASDPETARALSRLRPPQVMFTCEVKAKEGDRYLIDLGEVMKTDIADIAPGLRLEEPFPVAYNIERGSARLGFAKAFPENVLVQATHTIVKQTPPGQPIRKVPLSINYNIIGLPETDYRPRIGDVRVGYFGTTLQDLSDPKAPDPRVNYINRWNLQKADPTAKLSPPKKPLIWWIDNATPKQYRQAIREGLLMWNPAFEKVGIKDAIVVKQMPDDADWDVHDVRYNVVRWTVNMPFAIALLRKNPFTGEIVNAAINFDSSFAAIGSHYFDQTIGPASYAAIARRLEGRGCAYDPQGLQQAEFAHSILSLLDGTKGVAYNKDQLIHQFIREVLAHEVGHCMGLRHNFVASSTWDMKQLANSDLVAREGVTPTVMEYAPFNLAAVKSPGTDFYSRRLGRYDFWAIEYGYKPIQAKSPEGELSVLRNIASRTNEPGLAYHSDEMTNQYDPYVAIWDLSKNPLDWVERTMDLSGYLLKTLPSRLPKKGQSYYEFTRMFNSLVANKITMSQHAARFIGGVRTTTNYRGDSHERPLVTPVDGATQKRALGLIVRNVLAEKALDFPKTYYAKLTGNPNAPYNSPTNRSATPYASLSSMQGQILGSLLNSRTLAQVLNAQFRVSGTGTLTADSYMKTLLSAVWSELRANRPVSQLRRQLQQSYVDNLIRMIYGDQPGPYAEIRALSLDQLRSLQAQSATAAKRTNDRATRIHLEDVNFRITKALNAVNVINR